MEYEPNHKITRQHKQGMPTKAQFTFESVAGDTRVAFILEAEPGGFFKLAAPVLMPLMKRQFEGSLANLKKLMEAHAL